MLSRTTIIWKITIPVLCLVVGAAVGHALRDGRGRDYYVKREGGYRLINPLLECEGDRDLMRNNELQPFRSKVAAYLRDTMRYPGVESASVYFRELNDGLWFSLGEEERFTPASLRKVPLMIALFRQAERDPHLLGRKVRFSLSRDYNAKQTFKPSVLMTAGKEYTIEDLIRRMIVYSDNNAFMLLSGVIDQNDLRRTYEELDVRDPRSAGRDDFLSIHTYASFFRILYNATYISKERSAWALDLLTQVDFRDGIVRGVPADIPVAHKFGEHRDDAAGRVQLHDCGIIYEPQHPYLLCIMTRGTAFEHLDDAIASISSIIYSEVASPHRRHDRERP